METEPKHTFTIAHGFPTGSRMDYYVKLIAQECAAEGITGEMAKIGTHMTIFPPFLATDREARRCAAMIELALAPLGGPSSFVKISGIGFFGPPPGKKNDALHLRVELEREYLNLISRLKASDLFDWVIKPVQTAPVDPIYLPHVHIIEGPDLIRRVAHLKERFDHIAEGQKDRLYPIHLFKKIESEGVPNSWRMVIV